MNLFAQIRFWSLAAVSAALLVASTEQTASAQALLAQSGTKTAIGYGLTLLAILLGLLVVLRPSKRKLGEKKKQPAARR